MYQFFPFHFQYKKRENAHTKNRPIFKEEEKNTPSKVNTVVMTVTQYILLLQSNLLLFLIIICFTNVSSDETDTTDTYVDTTIIRDNTYYAFGTSDPVLENRRSMYWRDSNEVLNNLHLFQSLAVRFHSCVYVMLQLLLLSPFSFFGLLLPDCALYSDSDCSNLDYR